MDQGGNQQNSLGDTTRQQTQPSGQQPEVSPVQADTNLQPAADVQQQSTPVQPVSGPSKEAAPISQPLDQDFVRPTEHEPVLSSVETAAGVRIVPNQEHIQIKPELQEAGLEPVKTAVPVQTAPTDSIRLPMTEEEAIQARKTNPPVNSIKWYATEIIRQLHQAFRVKGKT